jgi:short-subunit dehydrogenase
MSDTEFGRRYGPWALVAGGSEGLGSAEALAAGIRAAHGREVVTLPLDLTAPDAVERVTDAVGDREIGLFVYNAGADNGFGHFVDRPIADAERMVALNVLTPMRLTRHFLAPMTARQRGGVILISSISSCAGSPGNAVYAGSKAFVNLLSETLWHEVGDKGVDVLNVIVGLARTPAMERIGLKFDGTVFASEPIDLVDEALAAIGHGPTLHSGDTKVNAVRLRSLPRDEAVHAMAAIAGALQ